MWQHRVEPIKRWCLGPGHLGHLSACAKARTEAVIQEIFRARGWHLDFETNRWIIQVPEPYPVVVFSNLWILMGQEIVCFLMIYGLVPLWFQFLATNISTFLIPNNIGFDQPSVWFVFVWKPLGFSRLHAGTKTMQGCDHIMQNTWRISKFMEDKMQKWCWFFQTLGIPSPKPIIYKSVLPCHT